MLRIDGGPLAGEFSVITSEQIVAAIVAETGLSPERLAPDATLAMLDISSLDVVSVIFALEDEFGLEIPPDGISPDFTLGRLVEHIGALAAK